MNDESTARNPDLARLKKQAIVSVVFGVISLPLAFLFIPGAIAVVFGYRSRRGLIAYPMNRRYLAVSLGGLMLGLVSFLAGAAMIMAASTAAIRGARATTARGLCLLLESAINGFHLEYGYFPKVASRVTTDSKEGRKLFRILKGTEDESQEVQNVRQLTFLGMYEETKAKYGILENSEGSIEKILDPFGHAYVIFLDADGDGSVEYEVNGAVRRLDGRRVAVCSPGKDGKLGTPDDIKSW